MNIRHRFSGPQWWLLVCFAISRVLYLAAGVHFQTKYIVSNFQFLDLACLRTRMLETLYYSHVQPPLMNAVLGVILKVFPTAYGEAFHAFHVLLGAGATLLLYQLMIDLAVRERIAFYVTLAFMLLPGDVLWENYPLYEYQLMFFLLLSSWALFRLYRQPSAKMSLVFFGALAALAYIRSLYHVYLLIAFVAILCWSLRPAWRAVLAGASVPVLAVLTLYLKNLAIFGFFGCSSWLGANMVVVTAHNIDPEDKAQLIAEGKLPPMSRLEPGDDVAFYAPFVGPLDPTGIQVLDEYTKQEGGYVNTNSMVYLKADPLNREIAKVSMKVRPQAYFKAVGIGIFCYLLPSTDFFHFDDNRAPIRILDRATNVLVFGQMRETTRKGLRDLRAQGAGLSLLLYTGIFMIVVIPVLLGWGLLLAWKGYPGLPLTVPQNALLIYLLFHITYIIGTTVVLSSFENNRYRFPTDPMYAVLLGTLLSRRTPAKP
jgi:4-amino-4-deoxy-L-arabinose transferase-like glycosyltransferase